MKRLSRLVALPLVFFYLCTPLLVFAQTQATTTGTTTVVTDASPSCIMNVNPGVINAGGVVVLSWQSTNTTGGTITGVGSVGPSGSENLLPSSASPTTFVGTFTGPGGTVSCSATVQINTSISGGSGTVPQSTSGSSGQSIGGVTNTGVTAPVTPVTAAPLPPIQTTSAQPSNGGLVPCGFTDVIGTNFTNSTGCQACSLAQLVENIITFLIGLSIPIAAALFAWAGILYFTSGANPGNIEKARGIFSNALVGFLIAITAWLVINTLLHVLLNNSATIQQGSWFTVQCDSGARAVSGNINTLLSSLPIVSTAPPISGVPAYGASGSQALSSTGSAYSCPSGYTLDGGTGYVDEDGNNATYTSCVQVDSNGNVINDVPPSCTSGAEPNDQGQCTDLNGNIVDPNQMPSAPLAGQCTGDLSSGSLAAASAAGGYALSSSQAGGLSCVAIYESTCGAQVSGATTPTGAATSANGPLQIVLGINDTCHNLNIPSCTTAAQSAGYNVTGNLNCSSAFTGGKPNNNAYLAGACIAAANAQTCYAPAAGCLVQQSSGSLSPWTADSRSSGQAQCIASNQ